MNFDVYEINRIFYKHIAYMHFRKKYRFDYFGMWDYPKDNNFFNVSLNLGTIEWIHSPHAYFDRFLRVENDSSFYQIDQHHFLNHKIYNNYYFIIRGKYIPVSLRELTLFMIYMRYLSNN